MNIPLKRAPEGSRSVGLVSGLLALLVPFIMGVVGLGAARAADADTCQIPADKIVVTATSESGSNENVIAWSNVRIDTALNNLDGLAEGCSATVELPDIFVDMPAVALYLNADGTSSSDKHADSVAVMSVAPNSRTISFVMTDYPATHTNVEASGWVIAKLNSKIERGTTQPVVVTVNGQTQPAGSFTVESCTTNCATVPVGYANKWGNAQPDNSGTVTLQSPVVEQAGVVTFKDTLESSDQRIVRVNWADAYDCVNSWGDPGLKQADGSCDTTTSIHLSATGADGTYSVTTPRDGLFVRLNLQMQFEGAGPWKDTAEITVAGRTYTKSASVTAFNAGGGGSGETPTTEPTTPTTEPTTPKPSTSTTPGEGPRVETDGASESGLPFELAAVASLLAMAAGSVVLVARRQR